MLTDRMVKKARKTFATTFCQWIADNTPDQVFDTVIDQMDDWDLNADEARAILDEMYQMYDIVLQNLRVTLGLGVNETSDSGIGYGG